MTIYFILLVVSFIFSFLNRSHISTIFILLFMFLVLAWRDESVGTDTSNYLEMLLSWNYNMSFSIDTVGRNMEVLWSLFVDFLWRNQLSYRFLIIIPAFLTLLFTYLSYVKFEVNVKLSLFFFIALTFYFLTFNITRQCLAMSVVLLGYSFLADDNKQLFLVTVMLATLIHFSAILCLVFYFVDFISINLKMKIACMIFSFILGMIGLNLNFLQNFSAYGSYAENLSSVDGLSVGRFLMRIVMTLLGIYFLYKNKVDNKVIVNLFFLSICAENLAVNMHHFISRPVFYLSMIQPVFYSLYFSSSDAKFYKQPIFYALLIAVSVFYIHYLSINSGEIVPYKLANKIL